MAYGISPKLPESERLAQVIGDEIDRDATKAFKQLSGDLHGDMAKLNDSDMLALAERNWGDAKWKQDFAQRAPAQFLHLAMQMGEVVDPEIADMVRKEMK